MLYVLSMVREMISVIGYRDDLEKLLCDECGWEEGDLVKLCNRVDREFKKEFVNRLLDSGKDYKVKDIMNYMEYVENESGWDCDYEIESLDNFLDSKCEYNK